ncbi:unnamed protein product [Sphenostylis stenocarpa]|uniref:BHLH domain-containing protein n=1 Tax=Sphenostylis stenocarpa TaxID=92480 RepID=A0AA86STF2_9FABA|nr:unnamed protein product [Sphenostylis stenocarpa]
MMPPNTYFNWDAIQISNPFYEVMQEEITTPNLRHLFSYSDESSFLSNGLFEPYIHPSYDSFASLTHRDSFPIQQDYHLPPCPKRQKLSHEREIHSSLQDFTQTVLPSDYLEGFAVPYDTCYSSQTEQLEQQFSSCEFLPQCVDFQFEKTGNEKTISRQSVAARERRRKITEKTQELGKLVPGGPKMNTGEMFHAAAKYVKYLQAQVEMLELMHSLERDLGIRLEEENMEKEKAGVETLRGLVVSPFVEEKLYREERCLVPTQIINTFTNLQHLQSSPTILHHLKHLLIETNTEKKAKQE